MDQGWTEGDTVGKCMVTYNRNRIKEAAAVLFHHTALDDETMPWQHYRDKDQLFTFMTMESPSNIIHGESRNLRKFDDSFINITMTHRRDSDVFTPYVTPDDVTRMYSRGKDYVDDVISKKKKVALWVVSNCKKIRGSRLRMDYVTKMVEAGLPVDRFGHCFKNKEEYGKLPLAHLQSYKFYLSFENAEHCKDYATEKFWRNGIQYGRVPVVWGPSKKDIEYLAPPGSYIHTEDFESPAKLVEYLLYLDKNDTAYREYFNWVRNPGKEVERIKKLYSKSKERALCDVIMTRQRKIIDSVRKYLTFNETKECLL
ncbi:3-galactosyl-N-acetylglucosaminide 4-alpha-L-fucosyltransferase FUT3-like isoform X2 [Ciona intestinalis]